MKTQKRNTIILIALVAVIVLHTAGVIDLAGMWESTKDFFSPEVVPEVLPVV